MSRIWDRKEVAVVKLENGSTPCTEKSAVE